MTGLAFGYVLIALIVVAFFVNFVNFKNKSKQQLQQYENDVETLMERLKKAGLDRENEQALIHKQTYIISEAEERIRRLEEKLSDLDFQAERLEEVAERYRRLSNSFGDSAEENPGK